MNIINKKIIAFATIALLASCNGKKYNNHLQNDTLDSSSLSAGKATRDSGTRLDSAAPANIDSSGEQGGRMIKPGIDTMGKQVQTKNK